MNVAMWGRAVRVIPRVSVEEWKSLDIVARWLIATRSAVLVMTFIASAIAGLLAYRDGAFRWLLWGLVTGGLLFAHATNNLINDFTDHVKGVDKDNYFRTQYGPQPLEHGLLSRAQMTRYIVVTGLIALACGVALVVLRGQATLTLLGIGAFFVLFYTWPLKYLGLGEPAVIVVWGPLMVGGGYYVVTGRVYTEVLLASLPFALAATTVLFGKHIDKLEADRTKKIRTMPVLLGERLARYFTIGMLTIQYLLVGYLVAIRYLSWPMAIVLLALPAYWNALRAYSHKRPAAPPPEYPKDIWPLWYAAFAFSHTRRFGGLYVLGLALDVILRRAGVI
jgi:1,4-dihydroxy-2-naphthoate polyprenyltransferase